MGNVHYITDGPRTQAECGVWRFAFQGDTGGIIEQCTGCGEYRRRRETQVMKEARTSK